MRPDEIEGREFFVGLRGYDREEVDQFLAEVAAEYGRLFGELEMRRAAPEAVDPLDAVGHNVSAVLRAATESADAIVAQAHADAEQIRTDALGAMARLREEAEAAADRVRADAQHDAAETRRQAEQLGAQAALALAEAEERAGAVEEAATRRGLERAEQLAGETAAALAETISRSESLRGRLAEVSDEIQLALLALGEPLTDPSEAVGNAVHAERAER